MVNSQWRSYEEVAQYLLDKFADHFGLLRVEGKQSVHGIRSGTKWTIDAKGVRVGSEAIVIVECRRHTTTKEDQEQLGGLAYRIIDTGAEGGIVVSPLGFQSGAKKVAESENILHVELHEDSTPTEFSMRFLNQIFVSVAEHMHMTDACDAVVIRKCKKCWKRFSAANNELICLGCSQNT
jgi:Restriction endonuclease